MTNLSALQLPDLHEHDFRSTAPLVGPVIGRARRWLYSLTAKWGVYAVIQQQNQNNQQLAQFTAGLIEQLAQLERQLADSELRLIEQDRDVAYLSRLVAELEIQQRYLAQRVQAQSDVAESAATASQ
jgi:hypothetical protein